MGLFGKKMLWAEFSSQYYGIFEDLHQAFEELKKEICIDGIVKEHVGSPFHDDALGKIGYAFRAVMIYIDNMTNFYLKNYPEEKLDFGDLLKKFEKLRTVASKNMPRVMQEYRKLVSEGKIPQNTPEYAKYYFLSNSYEEEYKLLYNKFALFVEKMDPNPKTGQAAKEFEVRNLEVKSAEFEKSLDKEGITIENALLYLKICDKLKELIKSTRIVKGSIEGDGIEQIIKNNKNKGILQYCGDVQIEKILYLEDSLAILISYSYMDYILYCIKGEIKMNGISAEFEITNTEYKEVKTYNFLNYINFWNIHDSFSEIETKKIDNEEATQEEIKKTNSSDIAKML